MRSFASNRVVVTLFTFARVFTYHYTICARNFQFIFCDINNHRILRSHVRLAYSNYPKNSLQISVPRQTGPNKRVGLLKTSVLYMCSLFLHFRAIRAHVTCTKIVKAQILQYRCVHSLCIQIFRAHSALKNNFFTDKQFI